MMMMIHSDDNDDGDKDEEEVNQYHSEEINPIMTLARCLLLRQKLTFSPLVDI